MTPLTLTQIPALRYLSRRSPIPQMEVREIDSQHEVFQKDNEKTKEENASLKKVHVCNDTKTKTLSEQDIGNKARQCLQMLKSLNSYIFTYLLGGFLY